MAVHNCTTTVYVQKTAPDWKDLEVKIEGLRVRAQLYVALKPDYIRRKRNLICDYMGIYCQWNLRTD